MEYRVLVSFISKITGEGYYPGDKFPKDGEEVSHERLEALFGKNPQGICYLEKEATTEDKKRETAAKKEQPKVNPKPKTRAKKA